MKPWQSAHLAELESLPGPGTLLWRPIRRRFGITAFGINAYTATDAGQDVVEEHTEQSLGHEELYAYAGEGEHEKAIAELERGLEERPAHPTLLYHLACVEARAGRRDAALEHINLAVAGDSKFRKWAEEDEDLASIRDDPRFLSITG